METTDCPLEMWPFQDEDRRFCSGVTSKKEPTMDVKQSVSLKRIGDLLCSAFEGGSNYWYTIEKFDNPVGDPESWAFRFDAEQIFKHIDYPLNEGGSLIVNDAKAASNNVRKVRLDLKAAKKGLDVMAQKHPRHFADFMAENDDAETGDVFLQCCLFGELVYG